MRVLVAEDEAISRRILESQLKRWGYEVTSVGNEGKGAGCAHQRGPSSAVILDWMMPEMDGVEGLPGSERRGGEPYVHTPSSHGQNRERDLILAMEAGGDDYVTKPFDVHELEVRLRAGRRIVELHEALIAARETMRYQATHDGLTSLWNRSTIVDACWRKRWLDREGKERVWPSSWPIWTTSNGSTTPMVTRSVTRYCERSPPEWAPFFVLEPIALLYGGEEFLIVTPHCDEPAALGVAERLRTCIASQAVVLPDRAISVTLSLGVAATTDPDRAEPEALIRAADGALYQAKAKGRNRVEVAGPLEPITGS